MSTAAATDATPPKKSNKKLIIIIAAVAVLALSGGGGVAVLLMQKKPADVEADAEAEDEGAAQKPPKAAVKREPKPVPTFMPLEPFTANLADRDAERYVQLAITLEVTDGKVVESIKAFMPAIRNNILLALADRTASELMDREGKRKLAEKIRRETSKALGFEVDEAQDAAAAVVEAEGKSAKKGKKKAVEPALPITAVHFSNFIIQ